MSLFVKNISSPAVFLTAGVLFYSVLAGASLAGSILLPSFLGFSLFPATPGGWVVSVASGAGAAAVFIFLSWMLVSRTESGKLLADRLAFSVSGLGIGGAVVLAVSAGVSEEMLFRGILWALLDSHGGSIVALLVTSVAFALVHGSFSRGLRLWSVFAFAAGLVAGGLFMATGSILAPVVMHVTVDAVNLPLLIRRGVPSCGR